MLNLRKLKQDFSPNILKEGKLLYDEKKVKSAKILHLDATSIRVSAQIVGQFQNTYESEMEFDRVESETIDSDCDCPHQYDCPHMAAVLYYLESCLDEILVKFSKEKDLDEVTEEDGFCFEEKEKLLEAVKVAEVNEAERIDVKYQKELIKEYISASKVLARSPFFTPAKRKDIDKAEIGIVFNFEKGKPYAELQFALRLPFRSKPLIVPNAHHFLECLRYVEEIYFGSKKFLFSIHSFPELEQNLLKLILDHARAPKTVPSEKSAKTALIDIKVFGIVLSTAERLAVNLHEKKGWTFKDEKLPTLPCIYEGGLESPLKFSRVPAKFNIELEYIHPPSNKILTSPALNINSERVLIEDATFLYCSAPAVIVDHVYYKFPENITRQHLDNVLMLREMTIPEPLFGTFVENSIPELSHYAVIDTGKVHDHVTTLPYTGKLHTICDLTFLDGELDISLSFKYDENIVPARSSNLQYSDISSFVTQNGVVSRNLVEEEKITSDLFQDFIFDKDHQTYTAKSEKKIIEFMTETIPKHKNFVTFNCPRNLLDQFIYDQTVFSLDLKESKHVATYDLKIEVKGALQGVSLNRLWDCIVSKKAFIELDVGKKQNTNSPKMSKILVLNLKTITSIIKLFDELGIESLKSTVLQRPIWTIANIDSKSFDQLPVTFKMSKKLSEIRNQMLGKKILPTSSVPSYINASLRHYQQEGVQWLERLRLMFLNGILADDMGLGKTLQAIVALSQLIETAKLPALVVCPTSLLYNWKEECSKFNKKLKTLTIDGTPNQRKKLIAKAKEFDVIITSYSLIQKDVDVYKSVEFSYMIRGYVKS